MGGVFLGVGVGVVRVRWVGFGFLVLGVWLGLWCLCGGVGGLVWPSCGWLSRRSPPRVALALFCSNSSLCGLAPYHSTRLVGWYVLLGLGWGLAVLPPRLRLLAFPRRLEITYAMLPPVSQAGLAPGFRPDILRISV